MTHNARQHSTKHAEAHTNSTALVVTGHRDRTQNAARTRRLAVARGGKDHSEAEKSRLSSERWRLRAHLQQPPSGLALFCVRSIFIGMSASLPVSFARAACAHSWNGWASYLLQRRTLTSAMNPCSTFVASFALHTHTGLGFGEQEHQRTWFRTRWQVSSLVRVPRTQRRLPALGACSPDRTCCRKWGTGTTPSSSVQRFAGNRPGSSDCELQQRRCVSEPSSAAGSWTSSDQWCHTRARTHQLWKHEVRTHFAQQAPHPRYKDTPMLLKRSWPAQPEWERCQHCLLYRLYPTAEE